LGQPQLDGWRHLLVQPEQELSEGRDTIEMPFDSPKDEFVGPYFGRRI
jgi:hypothetical protein